MLFFINTQTFATSTLCMSIFDALNVVLYLANVVFTSRKNKKIPVAPE